jgi:hypothetical protein
MISTSRNNSARPVVFGMLIAIFLLAFTAPASHAETYKYWSLWEGQNGSWEASQTSASEMKLKEGSVMATKYVETEEALTAADTPTQPTEYQTLCPDSPDSGNGTVNVAVVLDYGDSTLTPEAESTPQSETVCVAVPEPATGATALSEAAIVSATSDGFITTINGYPDIDGAATTATETETDTQESSGFPTLTVVLSLAVLVLIVIVAIVMIRGRNSSPE